MENTLTYLIIIIVSIFITFITIKICQKYAEVQDVICSKCGQKVSSDKKFCHHCGNSINKS